MLGPIQALQQIEHVLWHWESVRNDGRDKVGMISLSIGFADLEEIGTGTRE